MAIGGKCLYNNDMYPTKRRAKLFLFYSVTLFFCRFNLKKNTLIKFFLLYIRVPRCLPNRFVDYLGICCHGYQVDASMILCRGFLTL
jgi:hypothetical protein